jgi:hypothetical protein
MPLVITHPPVSPFINVKPVVTKRPAPAIVPPFAAAQAVAAKILSNPVKNAAQIRIATSNVTGFATFTRAWSSPLG